ncbi:MFS transporter [Streptomyces sp. NBC_01433]|uniref:MFS transporter n=1 Tax=Streptomyces sp. NBC_01433 TaxID=2903864 RepID=UPI002252A202|nr:MFS transporter [Streptomyces sp. NBC_01433]MCX4678790.1 MFS transporter [Streptomyces sp. NBC_01433]
MLLAAEAVDMLDVQIANVAAPSIRADLGGGAATVQWLGTAYALAIAVGLITGGRLGDIAGRKRMFLIGALGVTAASLLCAVSWSPGMLIGARALQGLFGAVMALSTVGAAESSCLSHAPRSGPGSASRAPLRLHWPRHCWCSCWCGAANSAGPRTFHKKPDSLAADKAYSDGPCHEYLRRRSIRHAIPERTDSQAARLREGSRGGRPPGFDEERHKRRDTVERAINHSKRFHAAATRHDKRGYVSLGTATAAALVIWLRT